MAELIGISILALSHAQACVTFAPRAIEDIKLADEIFIGDVARYRVKGCRKHAESLDCYALIDVRVRKTIFGKSRRHWTLYWWNSTFGVPEEWGRAKTLIFAGRWITTAAPPLRGGSATQFPSRRPDLLQVLQAPCSEPFFLPMDEETIAKVRAVIDEKAQTRDESENDRDH
ncbi:MAG TPA: hypothetical protein VNH64_05810 [Parvularculaceae bacterium]|nr:hypothetical protein [Parvularculaceae bacterium]